LLLHCAASATLRHLDADLPVLVPAVNPAFSKCQISDKPFLTSSLQSHLHGWKCNDGRRVSWREHPAIFAHVAKAAGNDRHPVRLTPSDGLLQLKVLFLKISFHLILKFPKLLA